MSSPTVPSRENPGPETVAVTAAGPGSNTTARIQLVRHGRFPLQLLLGIHRVRRLFDHHSFWARGRSRGALVRMLLGSCSVVSAWQGGELVGIGRATSDGVFRAVLWDVVVAEECQGRGVGRRIVQALLASPPVVASERVYLMTTNSSGFYARLGFTEQHGQHLLVLYRKR